MHASNVWFGPGMARSDFFLAEDRYMELLEAREQALAAGGGGWGEAQRKELEQAEEILADSTRVALRLLKVSGCCERARLAYAMAYPFPMTLYCRATPH